MPLVCVAGPSSRYSGSSSPAASIWDWDDLDPTHIVDPEATSNGSGSEISPLQPSQAWALSAASAEVRCEWLPGSLNITGADADYRLGFLKPLNDGTASRRIIHYARNRGRNVLDADRTWFRRTSGTGVIFGFSDNSYCTFDGFGCDTTAGGLNIDPLTINGECGQSSAWGSDHCKFIRIYSDHQFDTYDTGDRNNCFVQNCSEIEFADCIYKNIGGTSETYANVTLLMWYNSDGIRVHHCEFSQAPTAIWCKAQTVGGTVFDHSYHHNRIFDCGVGIRVSSPIQTTIANAVKVYQNQIYDCMNGVSVTSFGAAEPKGVIVVNNTIYNLIQRGASGDIFGTLPLGIVYHHADSATYVSGSLIVTRNNALYNTVQPIYTHDNSGQYDNLSWDRNAYNTFTNFWRQGEGGPTASLATWQGESPARDTNAVTGAPGFVNVGTEDVRPDVGSPLLSAGTDYLQLLGGATTDPINIGWYVQASDEMGPRF